jgi:2-keto-4-pentenoate hydratase/2-oxohepta-3-ene-1,7-dioic acid hydratase in catechol pathway
MLVVDHLAYDVADITQGRFGPRPSSVLDRWEEFRAAVEQLAPMGGEVFELDQLGCPSPEPRQVFAIGLNYASHAAETGLGAPEVPAVFTKFPAALSGPVSTVELSGDTVDWEVELVVVIGIRADRVDEGDAWRHVAGLSVGQDLSDRTVQFAAGGQFSLGKSYRGYGPVGPWLVTPDEFVDPNDVAIGCSVNGVVVQQDRSSGLLFTIPALIAELSGVLPLLPGDLIFTGTPAGVGMAAQPARYLRPGDLLESWADGIGPLRTRCAAPAH